MTQFVHLQQDQRNRRGRRIRRVIGDHVLQQRVRVVVVVQPADAGLARRGGIRTRGRGRFRVAAFRARCVPGNRRCALSLVLEPLDGQGKPGKFRPDGSQRDRAAHQLGAFGVQRAVDLGRGLHRRADLRDLRARCLGLDAFEKPGAVHGLLALARLDRLGGQQQIPHRERRAIRIRRDDLRILQRHHQLLAVAQPVQRAAAQALGLAVIGGAGIDLLPLILDGLGQQMQRRVQTQGTGQMRLDLRQIAERAQIARAPQQLQRLGAGRAEVWRGRRQVPLVHVVIATGLTVAQLLERQEIRALQGLARRCVFRKRAVEVLQRVECRFGQP